MVKGGVAVLSLVSQTVELEVAKLEVAMLAWSLQSSHILVCFVGARDDLLVLK